MPTLPAMLPRRRLGTAAAAVVGVAVSGLSIGVPGYRTALSVLPVPAAPAAVVAPVVAPTVPATPAVTAGPEVSAAAASPAATVAVPAPAAVPAGEVAATTLKVPSAADADGQGYVLEVALFESVSRGTRLVDELAAAGFPAFDQPLALGARGSFRQVLVGPFATRDDADRNLERLRQRGGYSDARVTARVPLRNGTTE